MPLVPKRNFFQNKNVFLLQNRRSLIELQIWGGSKFDDYQLGSMDDKPAYS